MDKRGLETWSGARSGQQICKKVYIQCLGLRTRRNCFGDKRYSVIKEDSELKKIFLGGFGGLEKFAKQSRELYDQFVCERPWWSFPERGGPWTVAHPVIHAIRTVDGPAQCESTV